MKRVEGQLAFVLHTRPYRDTSLLVELFCQERGRISAVARGARRPGARWRPLLQPFVPLLVSWQGRGELKTLVQLERAAPAGLLAGDALWCGLYLNELLIRLVAVEDPQPRLFAYYQLVLGELAAGGAMEPLLRLFERRLLDALGYGFSWEHQADGLRPLAPDQHYRFQPEAGFIPLPAEGAAAGYCGADLLAIAADDYAQATARSAAKRIMREALAPLLGPRPLKSRALFGGRSRVSLPTEQAQPVAPEHSEFLNPLIDRACPAPCAEQSAQRRAGLHASQTRRDQSD